MKKALLLLSLILLLAGCEKTPVPIIPKQPTKALLVFPYENSACNEGTNISETESTVLFEWEAGQNNDKFELKLKNLNTGALSTNLTTNTKISIVLNRGTPYAWYIISKSDSDTSTAKSAIWKFYNAGEGIRSYAPFPAEIISPSMAATISTAASVITLDWNGSDVDDDITGYDVYFGTTAAPGIFKNDLSESILPDVPIPSKTIYFWKIVTKDSHGNKSDSGVYQFKIK